MVRRRSLQSILRSAGAQETLKIGQPNDKYEQEADSVADRVMSMPDSQLQRQPDNKEEEEKLQARPLADQITPLVQRQEDTKEEEEPVQAKLGDGEIAQRQPAGNEEEEEPLQTKSSTGESSVATPDIESGINSLKSGGQPLDPATRSFFEPRFGRDFSHVRLHTDSTAADTARSIHARAFTIGNHVAMGSGEYQPNSQSGQRLLGHELTHVVQQVGQRPTSSVARVIQRQSPATAQPTLTQQLYNQAIASIASRSGVNTTLLAILRRGQVGRRTAGVHSASSTLTIPPPAGSTAGSTSVPAVRVIFDLEISPATTQLPQGAFAFFRNNPAGQTVFTGSATTGQTITRLLKIMTKAPTGATAANTLGEALVHEGTHMLLAIDELLSMTNNAGIPLSGGMTGAQTSFNRYVTVAASSPRRSGLITSLVTEVNRVFTPAGATRPTITATKANQAVGNVIVRILQERFAIDQQVAAYPRTVSNATVTRAYLWSLLAEETSRASWPRGPRATALETAMTLFLDDVTARLNRPTAAPSGGATTPTTPPAGSGTPKP